mgnify:CR=1 FL=1
MRIAKLFFMLAFAIGMNSAFADSLFFDDEAIQDGLPVFEMSKNFADVYEKLNTVKWGGKSLNVAIESLENLNKSAHTLNYLYPNVFLGCQNGLLCCIINLLRFANCFCQQEF